MSERDKREWGKYNRELVLGLVVYAVLLIGVLTLVDQESDEAKFLILLPMVGVVIVAKAIFGYVRRADEYSQLQQLRAMAVGFGASMLASTAFGFVGLADVGHPALGPWVIFSVGMAAYGIAAGVGQLKSA